MRMPVIVVMSMVIMRMIVAMMVIMCVIVIMMMSVPMVVIMVMPMMVSMIVAVAVVVAVAVLMAMAVLMAVAQIVLQIVFIVGLRRGLGRAGASAAGFRLGRFLIGRMSLGGLRALHLVSGQGSGFRFTLVMPAAMCMIVVMMVTMVVLMCMFMMMPMLVLVLVVVLMPMVMPMFVVVLMRMPMMMLMFMAVAMIMSMIMSASTAMLAQALVVELVRHLQPLLIQQRQRASTVAGCCAGRLDLLCRHAFSQQGQPLVEITMANAVDHQTRAGRCQRQRQSQLHQQVGRIAHQLFGLLGQHHQLGCVRQVETHRHMAGRHMLKPVGVSRGRHGLQPDANATAAPRGALRRLTACSPIRGLQ